MKRLTRRIGKNVEFADDKASTGLTYEELVDVLLCTLADCEDALESPEQSVLSAVFSKEEWLYKQKDIPLEIKAAMYWGALGVANQSGKISWDTMRNMFGEFMSKQLGLR